MKVKEYILLGREIIEGFKDQQYRVCGRYPSYTNEETFKVELGSRNPLTLKQFLKREKPGNNIGDLK